MFDLMRQARTSGEVQTSRGRMLKRLYIEVMSAARAYVSAATTEQRH